MAHGFKQWFLSKGGYFHPDVDIASNSNGLYLRTCSQRYLAPGSLVVSCPPCLTISWYNATRDPFLGQCDPQNASHNIKQYVLTRFFLVKQFLLQEQSPWWLYIRILPQPDDTNRLNTPLWYEFEDFAWIRGTNLELSARNLETAWLEEYEAAMKVFSLRDSKQTKLWSWLLYKWAATICTSRGFPGSALTKITSVQSSLTEHSALNHILQGLDSSIEANGPVLIPGLDLLNHRPLSKVTWAWGLSQCSLLVDELIKPGSQIWNNYGPKSNEELIIGYGFSLFRNSADFCSLHISPDTERRIATIKNIHLMDKNLDTIDTDNETGRASGPINNLLPEMKILDLETPLSQDVEQRMISGESNLLSLGESAQPIHRKFQWVCLKANISGSNLDDNQTPYQFSPGFLAGSSIAFANKREIAKRKFDSETCVDFSSTQFSRNRLHVMCAVTMILQRQQMAIQKYDSNLPPWPRNEKQFNAARYRRNQLQILNTVIKSLLNSLGNLALLRNSASSVAGFIGLEFTLTESPQGFLTDFRAALNAGLGTRNATKIRKNCWVECVFTIWLCGLCLWHRPNDQVENASPRSSFESKILQWLAFLRRHYGTPAKLESNSKPKHHDSYQQRVSDGKGDETRLLCTSFLTVIRAAIIKHPRSLYGSSDVTVNDLEWCLNIIREEGVMCPNLEGKAGEENDEFVLFLEDDAEED